MKLKRPETQTTTTLLLIRMKYVGTTIKNTDNIVSVVDVITSEHHTQVLSNVENVLRLAIIQIIILIRKLCVCKTRTLKS